MSRVKVRAQASSNPCSTCASTGHMCIICTGPSTHREPTHLRCELANLIWETSRRDEGTISGAGADAVADAVLGRFRVRR